MSELEFAEMEGAKLEIHQIAPMFHWTEFAQRSTREGMRLHRSAPITRTIGPDFWKSWRESKSEWTRNGYSVSKPDNINWQINQWLNIDGQVTENSLAKAAELKAAAAEKFLMPDWTPEGVELTSPQASFLYSYQRTPAMRLKSALMAAQPPAGFEKQLLSGLNGNALDASDTGTGKTIVSLVVCAELGLRPCVIAPLAVLQSWTRAAKFLGIPLGWVINYEKLRGGKSGLGRWKTTTAGKSFEFTYLPGNGNHLLIFDEVQKCKSSDSQQGQILRDAAEAGHKVLGLSATAAKDPTEMRNLGRALGLHDGTAHGFYEFCKYYGCYDGGYGLKFDWKKKQRLEELHRMIFPLRGQRIKVSEVPDFPETMISAEALDTGKTDEIKQAYDEMDKALAKAEGMAAGAKGAATLAAIMAARKASEKAKLPLFETLAKEAIEEGRSPAIFLNFRTHIDELAKKLNTKSIIWGTDLNGRAQKPDERQAIIDDFQHDRSRIVIVSLQAGGAGISLHDQFNGEFPRMSLISPSYSAIDLKQALGRIHRAGAKTKSFQQIIFAAGTIEEEICISMRKKLANIETINDGELQPAGLAERLAGVKLEGEAL